MALDIPLPGSFGKAFVEGSNVGSEILNRLMQNKVAQREASVKEQLMPSEIAKNEASARQSQMLADLMNGSLNVGGGGGKNQNADMQRALTLSGILKLPTQIVDGQLITPFGKFQVGETPEEKRKSQAKIKMQEESAKASAESAAASFPIELSLHTLERLTEHPSFNRVAGTAEGKLLDAQPLGIPVGSFLQSTFPGTFRKEDATLLGDLKANYGNITKDVAGQFKGPYKDMIGGIINQMKPNIGDSGEIQKSKIKSIKQAYGLVRKHDELVNDLVQKKGMDRTTAAAQVERDVIIPELNKLLDKTVGGADEATQAKINTLPENLRGFALDAIKQGADVNAVIAEAQKLQKGTK